MTRFGECDPAILGLEGRCPSTTWVNGCATIAAGFRVGVARAGLGHFFAPYGKAKVLAPKTLELQMETDQREAGAEKAQK